MLRKPTEDQYPPFFQGYISKCPDQVMPFLIEQRDRMLDLFDSIPENMHEFAYAEGKWTLKQLMIHIIEAERVFVYRSFALSRKEAQNLPGFDENEYVDNHDASHLTWKQVRKDFELTRALTIHQFQGFNKEQWDFVGTISGMATINSSLPFMVAGHTEHHIEIIRARYLS